CRKSHTETDPPPQVNGTEYGNHCTDGDGHPAKPVSPSATDDDQPYYRDCCDEHHAEGDQEHVPATFYRGRIDHECNGPCQCDQKWGDGAGRWFHSPSLAGFRRVTAVASSRLRRGPASRTSRRNRGTH